MSLWRRILKRRTWVLSFVAGLVLIVSAVRTFGVPISTVLTLLATAAGLLLLLILLAAVCAGLWVGVRRLLRRR